MKRPMQILAFGLALMIVKTAGAIITRHDLSDSKYLVADTKFPALVDLIGRGDCIGTLVHESHLLTVAHCAAELKIGHSLKVGGSPYTISKIILHPKWHKQSDDYDIAILRFSQPVNGVSPLPIYRKTDELGSFITLLGRGVHATGLKGERHAKDDGKLRRATNIVSAVNRHFLEIFFERAQEKGVTNMEGVGAAGDSGGPAFISVHGTSYVAGLNSYGDGSKGIGVGQYGSRDYQTRVSQYLNWLDSEIDFPSKTLKTGKLKIPRLEIPCFKIL